MYCAEQSREQRRRDAEMGRKQMGVGWGRGKPRENGQAVHLNSVQCVVSGAVRI